MCIVCYVIPVALHLKLYLSKSGYQLLEAAESPQLAEPLIQASPSHMHAGRISKHTSFLYIATGLPNSSRGCTPKLQ